MKRPPTRTASLFRPLAGTFLAVALPLAGPAPETRAQQATGDLPASFTLSLKLREGAKPLELVRVAGRGSINPFLMSKYEVTQAQYAAVIGKNPSAFPSGDNYPVETVNWSEAKDFSRKLTAALTGPLKGKAVFRLPTDAEWSLAVGLPPENGSSPKEKDFGNQDAFPWGKQWPPPTGAGNYGDRAAKRKGADWTTIEGYDDGYAETSPVGTFKPNPYGLCDLGGNVWEWCEDWYDDKQENRVLRGASWRTGERDRLASSRRLDGSPEARGAYVGFRVVLAPPGPEAPQSKAR